MSGNIRPCALARPAGWDRSVNGDYVKQHTHVAPACLSWLSGQAVAKGGFVKPVPFVTCQLKGSGLDSIPDAVRLSGADDGLDPGGVFQEPGDGDDLA
jgi:hypothetical protein